jgi:hypothetical protein
MIAITVKRTDGMTNEFQAVKPPWTWRTFTVIDTGTQRLSYIPTELVDVIEMEAA